MYSECAFCGADLGSNTVVPGMPVGRTIVFDSGRGRLWIVCPRCGRWNLAPMEERAGAIQAAERLVTASDVRDTTGEITRTMVDGVRLVRVGAATDQELTLWRHCARVENRDRVLTGTGMLIAVALPTVSVGLAMVLGAGWGLGGFAGMLGVLLLARSSVRRRVVTRREDENGCTHDLTRRDLQTVTLVRDDGPQGWSVLVHGRSAPLRFTGTEALGVLAASLALSVRDVTPQVLRAALAFLRDHPGATPNDILTELASPAGTVPQGASWWGVARPGTIHMLPLAQRVALEIIATEARERASSQPEIESLLEEWRTAELIAGIADDLLLPDTVRVELERLKQR